LDSDTIIERTGDETRQKLLASALSHFASRGFKGASIAQIAGDIGLTKQALLYYFKRKRDLHGEVMRLIAGRMLAAIEASADPGYSPTQQFEAMVMALYDNAIKHPDDARALMQEMLENERRDAPPDEWFLKSSLDRYVNALGEIEGLAELPFPRKFALTYQIIGGIQFFAASREVLERFYTKAGYEEVAAVYPAELQAYVRRMIASFAAA